MVQLILPERHCQVKTLSNIATSWRLPFGLHDLRRQPVLRLRGPEWLQGRQGRGRNEPRLSQAGPQGPILLLKALA